VVHLLDRGLERLDDSAIVDLARSESRIILTFDLDFTDLRAIDRASQPAAVIFRMSNATPQSVLQHLRPVLKDARQALLDGAVIIVEQGRYGVRKLPIL